MFPRELRGSVESLVHTTELKIEKEKNDRSSSSSTVLFLWAVLVLEFRDGSANRLARELIVIF